VSRTETTGIVEAWVPGVLAPALGSVTGSGAFGRRPAEETGPAEAPVDANA
jgi:hypothetical protein